METFPENTITVYVNTTNISNKKNLSNKRLACYADSSSTGQCMDEEERRSKRLQMIANYALLPFVLAIPPIVGWYIGTWIDQYFKTRSYGMYALIVLGMISGVREFYRIVKKYKDVEM